MIKTLRTRRVSAILLTLFLSILATIFTTTPAHASTNINILTHTGYLDTLGYYHVVGEVQSTADTALYFIKITAVFYNSTDAVIATLNAYPMIDVLLPGRKSPFNILLYNTHVHHYTLTLAASYVTDPLPLGLEILSQNSSVDISGTMHITGQIKNIGSERATSVELLATFYNASGNVVDASYDYSTPSDLDSGQTASFEVILLSSRVPYVSTYALDAQSAQYASVPECTQWTLVALTLATISAVTMKYRRNNRNAL